MESFFIEYKTIVIFLHVISAIVWIGGMVAMRYAAHPSFLEIESPLKRLEHISHALKNLFTIVVPFVIILLVTAVIMIQGYGLSKSSHAILSHAKEALWVVMAINLSIMIYRRNQAEKALIRGDATRAKNQLSPIAKIMVPLNIALGVLAVYLGTSLSGSF
ncbi:MAG: hypothetical protein RBR59_03475 [Sulfurimonadaceae bacterium]|jgi:uncharacterized membrane protein|nr:hypothetical protein [Sulfurimonadaceae bacterium]